MKTNSQLLSGLAAAAIYLASAGNSQALPPPPIDVPDAGSTGMLAGVAIFGLLFLARMLKR